MGPISCTKKSLIKSLQISFQGLLQFTDEKRNITKTQYLPKLLFLKVIFNISKGFCIIGNMHSKLSGTITNLNNYMTVQL